MKQRDCVREMQVYRRPQRGVAAIEFAIILPIFLAVAFGIVELARAMYEYAGVVQKVRGAARYLSSVDASVAENQNLAVCMVKASDPYADDADGCFGEDGPPQNPPSEPWLRSLAGATVTVNANVSTVVPGYDPLQSVSVTVSNYQYKSTLLPFLPFSADRFSPIITFSPISATMVRVGG